MRKHWGIPPEQNAECVAHMDDILAMDPRPYEPRDPVVNRDDQPLQRRKETRTPLPARPGQEARPAYEYEHNGTAAAFRFPAALRGWRKVHGRERRTAVDWAYASKELLEEDSPDAEKVILLCDNLHTQKIASVYPAFEPKKAWRFLSRLEIPYPPKHGKRGKSAV